MDLFRDSRLATGVAACDAPGRKRIEDAGDLPAHRVEVHRFWSNDGAIYFQRGVDLAARNDIRTHREAESGAGKIVVVAFLSEDRPEAETVADAVRVHDHAPSGEEGRIIARHLAETSKWRAEQEERRRLVVEPALLSLRKSGLDATYDGNTSNVIRVGFGREEVVGVAPHEGGWCISYEYVDNNHYTSETPIDPRLLDVLTGFGLNPGEREGEWVSAPMAADELPAAMSRLRPLHGRLADVVLVIWKERAAIAAQRKATAKKAEAKKRRGGVKVGLR